MRIGLLTTALAATLVLVGCSAPDTAEVPETPDSSTTTETPTTPDESEEAETPGADGELPAELVELGLDGLSAREVIDSLDRLPVEERPAGVMASVRPTELLVAGADDTEPTAIPIDGDTFYVSFAPYITGTHDCYFHSLTTCLGELGGEEISVTITTVDGEVLVDETTTTFANGFAGYWLPRDVEATLEVTYGDLSGSVEIATGPEDATCVTTLRLLA